MAFKDIPGVLFFRSKAIDRVAKDGLLWAYLIPALAMVFSLAVTIVINLFLLQGLSFDVVSIVILAFLLLVLAPALLIGFVWLFAGLLHLFAILFGAHGSASALFRARGHGAAVYALWFFPSALPFILLYRLALDVRIVQRVERLSFSRSFAVVLLVAFFTGFVGFALLVILSLWMPYLGVVG